MINLQKKIDMKTYQEERGNKMSNDLDNKNITENVFNNSVESEETYNRRNRSQF